MNNTDYYILEVLAALAETGPRIKNMDSIKELEKTLLPVSLAGTITHKLLMQIEEQIRLGHSCLFVDYGSFVHMTDWKLFPTQKGNASYEQRNAIYSLCRSVVKLFAKRDIRCLAKNLNKTGHMSSNVLEIYW